MIYVFLQDIEQPMLLIRHATGIRYTNQAGGCFCNQPEDEGYLIPVNIINEKEIFSCFPEGGRPDQFNKWQRQDIWYAVKKIQVFLGGVWYNLQCDISRFDELQEAWIPVTVNGRIATLIFNNSD